MWSNIIADLSTGKITIKDIEAGYERYKKRGNTICQQEMNQMSHSSP